VFGPLWGGESNSSYQIYYIQAITIVLSGAPPAENEAPGVIDKVKDDVPIEKVKEKEKEKEEVAVDIGGEQIGNGNGQTEGNGDGSLAGGMSETGGQGNGGAIRSEGGAQESVSATPGKDGEDVDSAKSGGRSGSEKDASAAIDTSAGGAVPFTAKGKFKVFEMISNANTNVAPIDVDLPYLPVAGPVAGGCVLAGGASFFIGFRRRLP
jgi:hypothetical protein